MKKIISFTLTVLLLVSMLITDVGAYAVDLVYEVDSKTKKPTDTVDYSATLEQYLTLEFATAEEKLESMELMYEKDGYQLWADSLTGEVATKDLASGQILFSNPYDIGATYPSKQGPSDSTKKKIFSQLMIRYVDNDTEKEMYSFEEAAMRGQIKIKNIKNGIRVEYSIGREETRMLVPKVIEESRFESEILDPFAAEINEISRDSELVEINWRDYFQVSKRTQAISDSGNNLWFNFNQLLAYYQLKAQDACATERERISLIAAYPICKKMNVYVFATDSTNTETMRIENYIKTYCPSYTYEMLEADHALTEYEGSDKNPALFKVSLEYTLDKWGMSVRCPVNGLRFDESLYQLVYISVLPYMGAGANYLLGTKAEKFTGYNFFPDGSGTLFRHEDLATNNTTTINAKVYGADFAYNNINGTHTETVRYPVFGIVTNYHDVRQKTEKVLVAEEIKDPTTGEVISPAEYNEVETDYTYSEDRGFVAIIEEGDALAELSTYHAGSLSKYNSVSMLFYPRPKDSYNLANAISVGANATWTVVSSRKYVGNYKIRYIMLTDSSIAEEKNLENTYEPTWMGMASAYRDYLLEKGDLTTLTKDDVKEDIPAYIETFGTLETLEKVLSLPVNVMTPLSSFENIKTMYDELSKEGVSNIKFKLTGYANGGMFASIPYKLKWEKAVGGANGYTDLVNYANENGFQVFPEFDFAYVRSSTNTLFDGLTLKKHIVKSINNTYMSKRYYSATRQTMMGRFELCVSAAYYSHFYEKLTANLIKYYGEGIRSTISVSTLGNALNSDFDEDEPYNREDSKKQTVAALTDISNSFDDVMTESANAYTWKYVDYIINLPLDSSRYTRSSASVPFIGVVLHGSKQFAGTPLNMEGNIGYSLLKAIENGAGVYFVLCYQNYAKLKENYVLSQYYSVRYDILKDDVVKYYTLINDLTKDLQLDLITSHEFLIGERVPDADEVIADAAAAEAALAEAEKAAAEAAEKARIQSLLNGRVNAVNNSNNYLTQVQGFYNQAVANDEGAYTIAINGNVTVTVGMKTLVDQVLATSEERSKAQTVNDEKYTADMLKTALLEAWTEISDPYKTRLSSGANSAYEALVTAYDKAVNTYNNNVTSSATKKTNLDNAVTKAITDDIAKIETLLKAYKENPNDDTLAALTKVSGTVADAEKYIELTGKLEEATKALAAYKTAYTTAPEYVALLADKSAKAAEYKTAEAADKAIITELNAILANPEGHTAAEIEKAEAYSAALAAYNTAKTEYNSRLSVLKTEISSATKALDKLVAGSDEYIMVEKLIADAQAELDELNDATNTTNSYKANLAAAQAAVDAFTPDSAAAKAASEAADKAVSDYTAKYAETYTESSAYKADESAKNNIESQIEALKDKFTAIHPVNDLLKAYAEAVTEKNTIDIERTKLKNAYNSDAEYQKLIKAADEAAAKFAEVSERLNGAMESDAEYIALQKKVEETKAALEVYTLAYKEEADYLKLAKELEEAQAKADKYALAYLEDAEYKTLNSAYEAAKAEYDAALAESDAAAKAGTLTVSDALVAKLTAAADKYAAAKSALDIYMAKFETELAANDDYKDAVKELTAAEKAEKAYVDNFVKELDDAATASKDEEHPEDTKGGKYAIALSAYETAVKYLGYFDGSAKVPANVKDAVVYADKVKTMKEYTDAETAKTTAANEASSYLTKTYSPAVLKDPVYLELTDKFNAATTKVNEASAALKAVSSAVNTAANTYYTALLTEGNALVAADREKARMDATVLKATYDAEKAEYAKIETILETVTADAKTANDEYKEAAAALTTATKASNDAIKSVRDQVNRITSTIVPRMNYYVGEMLTTLKDSNYAMEVIGNSSEYSQQLKDDLKASNAIVVETEAQIKELSGKILASAKHALETASKIMEINTVLADPYNPVEEEKKDDETTDDEEEEEEYEYTKYTDNSGNIVALGYSGGVKFLLNYNYFDVTTVYNGTTYTLPAYGGVRINVDGTTVEFNTSFEQEGAE